MSRRPIPEDEIESDDAALAEVSGSAAPGQAGCRVSTAEGCVASRAIRRPAIPNANMSGNTTEPIDVTWVITNPGFLRPGQPTSG